MCDLALSTEPKQSRGGLQRSMRDPLERSCFTSGHRAGNRQSHDSIWLVLSLWEIPETFPQTPQSPIIVLYQSPGRGNGFGRPEPLCANYRLGMVRVFNLQPHSFRDIWLLPDKVKSTGFLNVDIWASRSHRGSSSSYWKER